MPLAQGACRVGGEKTFTLPLRELFEEPALVGGVHGRGQRAASVCEAKLSDELINSMGGMREAMWVRKPVQSNAR